MGGKLVEVDWTVSCALLGFSLAFGAAREVRAVSRFDLSDGSMELECH